MKKRKTKEDLLISISAAILLVIIALSGFYVKISNEPEKNEIIKGKIGELYSGGNSPSDYKSDVYTTAGYETTESESSRALGKTAGEIALWSVIWIIIVIFCMILIYLIYSFNKKRTFREKTR